MTSVLSTCTSSLSWRGLKTLSHWMKLLRPYTGSYTGFPLLKMWFKKSKAFFLVNTHTFNLCLGYSGCSSKIPKFYAFASLFISMWRTTAVWIQREGYHCNIITLSLLSTKISLHSDLPQQDAFVGLLVSLLLLPHRGWWRRVCVGQCVSKGC